jgi:hypothetical protein
LLVLGIFIRQVIFVKSVSYLFKRRSPAGCQNGQFDQKRSFQLWKASYKRFMSHGFSLNFNMAFCQARRFFDIGFYLIEMFMHSPA